MSVIGTIDDVRNVFQDLAAPDLKVLGARLDAIEKTLGTRIDAMGQTFSARLDTVDTGSKLRDELILARLDHLASRIDGVSAKMETNHSSLMYALSIEKRLDAIERSRARELIVPAS